MRNSHASKDVPSSYDILATCFLINKLLDPFSYRANKVPDVKVWFLKQNFAYLFHFTLHDN